MGSGNAATRSTGGFSGLDSLSKAIRASATALPGGAKRKRSTDPVRNWSSYYAGYSLEFAEAVLRAIALPGAATVFDPWNGSGTTTLAATRLGFKGRGIDLNPFAVLLARARIVDVDDAKGVLGFVQASTKKRSSTKPARKDDPLGKWLHPETVREFRSLQHRIFSNFASGGKKDSILHVSDSHFPPLASFLLLGLIRAAKSLVRQRQSSNPTLFRRASAAPRNQAGQSSLRKIWADTIATMGNELLLARCDGDQPCIKIGDSREKTQSDASVDFILTSPPYCTRLDYAESTAFELAAIEFDPGNITNLRKSLMGVPLVRESGRPEIPLEWPDSVREILWSIRSHPSKASDSYYYKTYLQYFSDACLSIQRLAAAMKPKTGGAFVVQSSYYKSLRIDLPSLYVDLARSAHLSSTIAYEMPVRTIISTIHPGTPKYRPEWDYRESIVTVWKE